MRQIRLPLISGLAGGAIVAVLLLVLGVGGNGKTTTVLQQAPLADVAPAAQHSNTAKGLTAAQIYKRDAPGVVFIRSQIVERTQSPFDLLSDIPAGKTVVSESGIDSRDAVEELERVGVDAVLVGETLMRAADPEEALRGLGSPFSEAEGSL